RVPMLVISPWAKHHNISHTQYDTGSILKYIEENFGTGSLGTSDATANSIGDVFDFTQARPQALMYQAVEAPYPESYFLSPRASGDPGAQLQAVGGAGD